MYGSQESMEGSKIFKSHIPETCLGGINLFFFLIGVEKNLLRKK